jgi:hypothetical protein
MRASGWRPHHYHCRASSDPRAELTGVELAGLVFEVTRKGGPTFRLTEKEVAHYLNQEMKVQGGWP